MKLGTDARKAGSAKRSRGEARRSALAYQGAFESVFAIGIGAGFGYLADAQFDTSPWGVLTGVLLGFGAFILRLVRLAKQLNEIAEAERTED